jgi:hypothetical protein
MLAATHKMCCFGGPVVRGARKFSTGISALIRIAPEVQEALRAGRPVVALESTIISHGMP